MSAIPKISSILNIGQEDLEKESLKTYLHIKLMGCESEIFNLAKKYGIQSIEEFEERYKSGEIEEEGTWEDFFRLDHLEAEKETIKKAYLYSYIKKPRDFTRLTQEIRNIAGKSS